MLRSLYIIPAAALPSGQQLSDIGGGLFHLGEAGIGLPEANGGGVPLVWQNAPEEVGFQVSEGGVIPGGKSLQPEAAGRPPRQIPEAFQGPEGRLEDFLPAVQLAHQGHGNGMGLLKEDGKDAAFLGGKVGEPVQKEVLVLHILGFSQMVAELGHTVPRVQAGAMEAGFIGGVDKAGLRSYSWSRR